MSYRGDRVGLTRGAGNRNFLRNSLQIAANKSSAELTRGLPEMKKKKKEEQCLKTGADFTLSARRRARANLEMRNAIIRLIKQLPSAD